MNGDGKTKTEYRRVPLDEITSAYFNPKQRTNPEVMAELMADVAEVGILTPILLVRTDDKKRPYSIADGHRRYHAAVATGWMQDIPAVIVTGMAVEEAYQRQFMTRKVGGKEKLDVYLRSPKALPKKQRDILDREMAIYGRDEMDYLKNQGASAFTFVIVRRVDKYLFRGLPDTTTYGRPPGGGERRRLLPENMKVIARWIVEKEQQGNASKAVESSLDAGKLWKAIKNGDRLYFGENALQVGNKPVRG